MNGYAFLQGGESDFAKSEPCSFQRRKEFLLRRKKNTQFDSFPFKTEVSIDKSALRADQRAIGDGYSIQYIGTSRKQIRIQRRTEDMQEPKFYSTVIVAWGMTRK